MPAYSKYNGFTLIELIIVIGIFAILASFAVPSFQQMTENAKIKTATDSILSGLQIARAEAVKRNTSIQFDFRTDSAWTICVRPAGGGSCPGGANIKSRSANDGSSSNVKVTGEKGPFVFNSFGLMTSPTSATATMNIDNNAISAADSRDLRIVVQKGGAVRSCDPALTDVNDLRKC